MEYLPFKVIGDYELPSQCLLEEFDNVHHAISWAKGYARWGDLGGYSVVQVVHHGDDGEINIIHSIDP